MRMFSFPLLHPQFLTHNKNSVGYHVSFSWTKRKQNFLPVLPCHKITVRDKVIGMPNYFNCEEEKNILWASLHSIALHTCHVSALSRGEVLKSEMVDDKRQQNYEIHWLCKDKVTLSAPCSVTCVCVEVKMRQCVIRWWVVFGTHGRCECYHLSFWCTTCVLLFRYAVNSNTSIYYLELRPGNIHCLDLSWGNWYKTKFQL